ncbi:MAG: hypothetical protein EBW44_07585 [Rhodobacteraceae bacterium]|nr:hypothetical protein [Paracoccaceae bacterium]
MGLDSKSYEAYRKNGFVAGIPVFSAQSVAEIRGEIEALEAQYSKPTDTKDLNQFFRVNGHLVIPLLADLARTPEILNVVETILGPNLLVWSVELFIKEAQTTKTVSWHQDITYWGMGETDDEVTAWVAATAIQSFPTTIPTMTTICYPAVKRLQVLAKMMPFTVHFARVRCRCTMGAAFTHLGRTNQMIDALGLPYGMSRQRFGTRHLEKTMPCWFAGVMHCAVGSMLQAHVACLMQVTLNSMIRFWQINLQRLRRVHQLM